MLDHENHSMQDKNDVFENYRHLTQRNTGGGAIFTCAGFRVAIMWSKTSLFLFDSHSRNNQGFHDRNGKATLLEFRWMTSLNNFLKTFFIENVSVSAETQYDLQYISVNVSDENKHQILDSLGGRRRKSFYNGTYSESHTVHKEKKRKYYSENIDFIREKHPLYYSKNAAFIKEKQYSYYAKNYGLIREKRQNYCKKNSETKAKKRKEYYIQNRDTIRKKQSTYYFEKINEFREKCSESYCQNPSDLKQKCRI